MGSFAGNSIPAEKILSISVDESGTISVGRDTVSSDNLAKYIQERLFKSFMGTGHMHDRIVLIKKTDVPEVVMEVIVKEIQEGQRRALVELCLQKFKRTFDNIEGKQQDRLRKQYPVLFQTSYLQSPGV